MQRLIAPCADGQGCTPRVMPCAADAFGQYAHCSGPSALLTLLNAVFMLLLFFTCCCLQGALARSGCWVTCSTQPASHSLSLSMQRQQWQHSTAAAHCWVSYTGLGLWRRTLAQPIVLQGRGLCCPCGLLCTNQHALVKSLLFWVGRAVGVELCWLLCVHALVLEVRRTAPVC